MRLSFSLALALLLTTILLAGCNVLEPFYSEGGTAQELAEDARHARASGDYARAVTLLEKALEQEPTNPVIRLDLSRTLLQRDRLNLLDLERITMHLLEAVSAPGSAARPADANDRADVCTFGPEAHAEPFDPRTPDYDRIVAARPTLRRVLDLLSDPEASTEVPAMPAALTSLDICTVLADGGVNYDRPSVLAAVRGRFETEEQVTAALTMNALALTLTAYISLFEQPDLPVHWFVVDGAQVGACVAESQYDLFVGRAQAEVQRVGQALISFDLLEAHTGHAEYAALVDDAVELYETVRTAETNPCAVTE